MFPVFLLLLLLLLLLLFSFEVPGLSSNKKIRERPRGHVTFVRATILEHFGALLVEFS